MADFKGCVRNWPIGQPMNRGTNWLSYDALKPLIFRPRYEQVRIHEISRISVHHVYPFCSTKKTPDGLMDEPTYKPTNGQTDTSLNSQLKLKEERQIDQPTGRIYPSLSIKTCTVRTKWNPLVIGLSHKFCHSGWELSTKKTAKQIDVWTSPQWLLCLFICWQNWLIVCSNSLKDRKSSLRNETHLSEQYQI